LPLCKGEDLEKKKVGLIFSQVFEQVIAKGNIDLAIQCFATLKEMIINSSQNQISAAFSGILQTANRLLLSDFYKTDDIGEDPDLCDNLLKLKLQIIEFLLELSTNDHPEVVSAMVTHISAKGKLLNSFSWIFRIFL
jgi:hypothetical protein